MISERTTKYTNAVKTFVADGWHPTNSQILIHLRQTYPNLSATTVHRITARMVERGELACAPPTKDNCARFDSNTTPHDHFQCVHCDTLRDVELPQHIFDSVQHLMGDCKLNGRLNIQGSCGKCLNHTEER